MPSHFQRVALRDPEPFSQMLQPCASCPSIRGDVAILQSIRHAIIHKHETSFRTENRYNTCACATLHRVQTPRRSTTEKAHSERTLRGQLKKWTEGTEACAQKITQSEGKDSDSMWTLTQESYRDEAKTVCHNCLVGGIMSLHPRHKKMHSIIF